ncbi:MAG: nucleotidyltransferase family protein [Deltaproteobacteria bacterium]|nr:nucleotidyltransferase family protein [Deltaproteobacteria bacterium]
MADPLPIGAAILAGGLGTRLRSAVPDRPKALAAVSGRPCLTYLLDQLDGFGIRDVVLCTGHRGEEIREAIGDHYGEMRVTYSREREPLGTAGALRLALPYFQSDPVLVMNGDSYCEADFNDFHAWHLQRGAAASLIVAEVPDTSRFGRVRVSGNGYVQGFEEKGGETGPGRINAGVYLLGRAFLSNIPFSGPASLERDLFPSWIIRGLHGYLCRGRFIDIGTAASYAEAERFFNKAEAAGSNG